VPNLVLLARDGALRTIARPGAVIEHPTIAASTSHPVAIRATRAAGA